MRGETLHTQKHATLRYMHKDGVSYGAVKCICLGALLYAELIVKRLTKVTGYETSTSRSCLCKGAKTKSRAGRDPGG